MCDNYAEGYQYHYEFIKSIQSTLKGEL